MTDKYEDYSRDDLIRLIRDRDRERKPKLGLVWERDAIDHDRSVNADFIALDLDADQSCGDATHQNLIIEGDNFDALRYLRMTHNGQVKCIYIDPPYNTGNKDFIYNDHFIEKDDSYRHSKWLEFMYRRFVLAKELLADDGVIFVSIDDNEAARLRVLMDQVFGENNFITQFIWNTEGHTDNQFHIKVNHEYILMYAGQKDLLEIGYVVDLNTREESNLWAGFAENSITKNGHANPPSEITLPKGFPCKAESINLSKSDLPNGIVESMKEHGLSSNQIKAKFGRVQFPLRFDQMFAKNYKLDCSCRVFSGWANANKLKAFIKNKCEPMLDSDGLMVRFFLK